MGCKKKIKFKDYPISNYDIIKWIKYLEIKNFKDVFSRDTLLKTINKYECGIINLDDSFGSGSHWVCYFNNYYFDPFGMHPPLEVINILKILNIMIFNIKTLKVFFVDIIVCMF